jgi:hypothetical protein
MVNDKKNSSLIVSFKEDIYCPRKHKKFVQSTIKWSM